MNALDITHIEYLRLLRKNLADARINAQMTHMDEHFISELNNLQSVVNHHIEEETKCPAQP